MLVATLDAMRQSRAALRIYEDENANGGEGKNTANFSITIVYYTDLSGRDLRAKHIPCLFVNQLFGAKSRKKPTAQIVDSAVMRKQTFLT